MRELFAAVMGYRKEVRRIAEAVRRASDKPAGLPRKQPQTKRRVPVG